MEQHSQRKTLFSDSFQKTNLIIGGCVRTTHPDIPFAGGRRNCYNALIEILLLVITIAAWEFYDQHWRRLWEDFFLVNPIPSNCRDDFTLKVSLFRQR